MSDASETDAYLSMTALGLRAVLDDMEANGMDLSTLTVHTDAGRLTAARAMPTPPYGRQWHLYLHIVPHRKEPS